MSDQTPPERIAELEDRIEELEATIRKMLPGRRDAMKLGGAAALGAAAMSGTASAGSSQVGTIGDASNLVDIEAEDVNVSDTINGASVSGAAAGEALTSDGSGGLAFASVGGGLPANFSYSDEKNNRAINQLETNNTGSVLYVKIIMEKDTSSTSNLLILEVGGNQIEYFDFTQSVPSDSKITVSAFVPDGETYELKQSGFNKIYHWWEAEL